MSELSFYVPSTLSPLKILFFWRIDRIRDSTSSSLAAMVPIPLDNVAERLIQLRIIS